MMTRPVELLGDLFVVAGKKLGVPAERLMQTAPLSDLESLLSEFLASFEAGEVYPSLIEEIAICSAWTIHHQPFPKYNREIGYAYMRLMLEQAEVPWPRPQEDAHQIESMLGALEDGLISEAKFVDWVCLRVATA